MTVRPLAILLSLNTICDLIAPAYFSIYRFFDPFFYVKHTSAITCGNVEKKKVVFYLHTSILSALLFYRLCQSHKAMEALPFCGSCITTHRFHSSIILMLLLINTCSAC